MERIVVGIKPGEAQPWVLQAAAELANQTGAEVAVLAVDEIELEKLSTRPRADLLARAEQAAESAVQKLRDDGVVAMGGARSGLPFEQIMGYADAVDADLILVGASHKGRLASVLLGSVPLSLVRSSRRPVLVVSEPS